MPVEPRLIAAFAIAAAGTLALTPLSIRLANRTSFFDHPVGYKGHASPTPYLGGLAVVAAFTAAATVSTGLDRLWPLAAGALLLCALGTLDDRRPVSPTTRVCAEAAIAAGLWATGLGWSVTSSELVNLILTVLWIVAAVNAFNLMDNMDGTAASCGAASALGIAALAATTGRHAIAAVALALAGACLGFLPFNLRSPARIFLGDGGSMPIGFLAGGLAMAGPALEAHSSWVSLAGVLLVGLPLTDTTLVTISRRRRGISILTGGRDHLTHRLLSRLGSTRLVAVALAAAQAGLAVLAIVGNELGPIPLAWISVACLLCAGATIMALEKRPAALGGRGPASEVPVSAGERPARTRLGLSTGLVAGLGAICGLSPLLAGFYPFSVWGPIALGVIGLVFALLVAGERVPSRIGLAAISGVVALALVSLLSTRWAESADRALVEADRWMLYAAFFALALLLIRSDRTARLALGAAAAGTVAVAGYVLAVMVAGDGPSLFQSGRLFEPLGYVNSQGLFLVLGFWPLAALAQYAKHPALRGVGAAGATAMACLALLTQARSVAVALLASAIVVMIAVPGRQHRAWLLLVVLGAVLAVGSPLLDLYHAAGGNGFASAVQEAGRAALLGSVLAGLFWATLSYLAAEAPRRSVRTASTVALTLLAASVVGVTVARAPRIADDVRKEAKAFRNLNGGSTDAARNRFLSGGGKRYDFWRIALREFQDHPVTGVGAGGYTRDYFVLRRTTEDVRQPHSIEFQTLAELGILGAGALALFLAAVAAGGIRRARARPLPGPERALLAAAAGTFAAWFAHASVDWSHLVPGAAGVGLIAAAVLVTRPGSAPPAAAGPEAAPPRSARPLARLVLRTVVSVGIAVAAVAIARPVLAAHYRADGERALERDPIHALAKANQSLTLNSNAIETHYLKAAAYARLDDYQRARSILLRATALEPHNFVPWALLGDVAVRRQDLRAARAWYTRAWRLNPRDTTLDRLRRNPTS